MVIKLDDIENLNIQEMVEMVKKKNIPVLSNLNDYRMILSNASTTTEHLEEGNFIQIILSDAETVMGYR